MFRSLRKYWERQKVFREIGSFDQSGLVYAAEEGNLECLEILLRAGITPNAKSERGYPAICRAVHKDHLPAIRMLMEAGADPDLSDSQGTTPLMCSIRSSNRHIFAYLMEQEPDLERTDINGETVLFKAVKEGNTTLTRKLIEAGAEVDVVNNDGITPLMIAVRQERIGVVKALLNAGADPNIRSKQGKNVLDFDVQSPRVVRMLRKSSLEFRQEETSAAQSQTSEKPRPLFPMDELSGGLVSSLPTLTSSMLRMLNMTLQVLNSPYRADDVEQHGRELVQRLFKSAANGTAEVLNGHGPDPNDELKVQLSQLIQWLQHQGVTMGDQPSIDQVQLDRSLLEAAALGAHRIVPVLLNLGADCQARDGEGNTPLHLAVGHPSVVKQLLSAGAKIGAVNQKGNTPYQLAARHGYAASLELLTPPTPPNGTPTQEKS